MSETISTTVDKYEHGKCPHCPGFLMLNSKTGKPFPTCYNCSYKFKSKKSKNPEMKSKKSKNPEMKSKKPEMKSKKSKNPEMKSKKPDIIQVDGDEVVINISLEAVSTSVDKYEHGTCPRCPGFLMLNSKTGKPFPTCYNCSSKCKTPDCDGFRGKSAVGFRYEKCPKCTFGDKYKKPEIKSKNPDLDIIQLDEEVFINDDISLDTISN